eukprot:scaffold1136_cov146-Cylindrotheca_fusiformis.AAC.27
MPRQSSGNEDTRSASLSSRKSQVTHQSNHSSSGGSDSTSGNGVPPQVFTSPTVGKREEADVLRARCLVALILLVAVSGVATAANLLVKQQERKIFENQFVGYATQIGASARSRVNQFFDALDSFASSIGAHAEAENALLNTSWPFYRIPSWSVQAEKLAKQTGVENPTLGMAPIVQEDKREQWERFAAEQHPIWYQESIEQEGYTKFTAQELVNFTFPYVHFYDAEDGFQIKPVSRPGEVAPWFQTYPVGMFVGDSVLVSNIDSILASRQTEEIYSITKITRRPNIGFTRISIDADTTIPGSQILQPIFDRADTEADGRKMVAYLIISLPWMGYFTDLLADGEDGIIVVLESACPKLVEDGIPSGRENLTESDRNIVTYQVDGPNAVLLGEADLHDPKYDSLVVNIVFLDLGVDQSQLPEGSCVPKLTLHVYPSAALEESFKTDNSLIYTVVIVVIFAFTCLVFMLYDFSVGRRQRTVMDRIVKQDRIVSDVFPTAIRDRLYENQAKNVSNGIGIEGDDGTFGLNENFYGRSSTVGSAPLADLFPSVTVTFADLVGFTAWSSAREPHHVFILLETIYGAFDKLAYRHGVFKVETVGDCYVAAAGLPEPKEDHAVAACRFARDCLRKMKDVILKLEVSLGPDTSDLDLRTGIHSGQVTAGVLRGERSRFQLFGDTMNTAARMESSGERNRIQISQVTANLITEAGLAQWIIPRSTKMFVKGKGEMQTYWVRKNTKSIKPKGTDLQSDMSTLEETAETEGSSERTEEDSGIEGMNRTDRLVEWNVDVLASLLEQVVVSRGGVVNQIQNLSEAETKIGINGGTVLEEFTPVIPLKRFDAEELERRQRTANVDIGEEAKYQLRHYISTISGMYPDNAFHNFDHASHVTASVKKLLARIVNIGEGTCLAVSIPSESVDLVDLAGHSYGITSDPLTQFTVVFSALIHDVDHPGVPNTQLVKENTRCAQIYKKSVAEQKSVDIAWDMLMSDEYSALRACIYQTEDELRRFRQLVVNTVLATDIADRELQALRKARWETAFSNVELSDDSVERDDRKATIVIEHLIQASDVSHTMQHWHIFKKWNERFFMECYRAYKEGRADSDPSQNWYKGEIGFFDYYVIPLARKLQSCGVFGVSSDEYLNYAIANREEWVREGEALIQQYLVTFKRENLLIAVLQE